jgi:hypothetical protein
VSGALMIGVDDGVDLVGDVGQHVGQPEVNFIKI